ncbi:hypothetical protein FB451DRAFT_1249008 [Mycena latifolia]|nr:hypothetical protein FB451DRAFT_1249008 [Mycena latifolia]
MRFLLTAAPLLSLLIAVTSAEDVVQDICDPTFGRRLAAFKDKVCQCQTNTFIRQDGGTACADGLPANAKATCINIVRTAVLNMAHLNLTSACRNVGWKEFKMRCRSRRVSDATQTNLISLQYQCLDGYTDDGKRTCTQATKPPSPTDPLSPACPAPMIVSYSSPTGPCGCVTSFNLAKKRKPDAVQCMPPPSNGNAACKNVGTGSKCTITCNDGFKPSADEKSCIATAKNEQKSELDCGADAGKVGFLSADPVKGCICETEKKDTFCGVSFGDEDAEMMCSDNTDTTGKREVKCAVKCSDGFTAKDKNTCEKVEVEGDSVTMAGTAKPRDSEEVSCSDKVFRLPGKGGCKCAPNAPTGATECPGVGPKEYAICQYEKGSGEEASCTTECIKGAYKKGPSNLCA